MKGGCEIGLAVLVTLIGGRIYHTVAFSLCICFLRLSISGRWDAKMPHLQSQQYLLTRLNLTSMYGCLFWKSEFVWWNHHNEICMAVVIWAVREGRLNAKVKLYESICEVESATRRYILPQLYAEEYTPRSRLRTDLCCMSNVQATYNRRT